ncbi:MAG: GH1 family beta-glucosidase [Paracoccaceae bacterium]
MSIQDLADRFPQDFIWGVAGAAYQIEGAAREDGRGPSIWDAFSHMPGRVHGGDTGDIACDHYHRWEEDLDLVASLNVGAYRFSISWPRIFPNGVGALNEAGLGFYDRLLDGLKARNLKAFATLYHWDLPLALMARGGWTDRGTADAFADYTGLVTRHLGDRIDTLATFNEPWCISYKGHFIGDHAPGERSLDAALAATHVINLAHGKACLAARAERSDIPMGVVLNAQAIYPASASDADQAAAERHFQFHNDIYMGPMMVGRYGDQLMESCADKLNIEDGDMAVIHQPLEWWGFNYYCPVTIQHDADPNVAFPATKEVLSTTSGARTDIGWEIKAEGLSHLLTMAYDRYANLPPCYITENGACYNIGIDEGGAVNDQPRLDYLRDHISVVADTIDAGIPVNGYFAWSLMDNFEWAEGFSMRFGIVHVNYETQERTIKKSGQWLAELAGHMHR